MVDTDPSVSVKMPLTDDDGDAFENAIAAFEAAWQADRPPHIRPFVDSSALSPSRRAALLHELIRVDLEFRWRNDAVQAGNGLPPGSLRRTLEYYLDSLSDIDPIRAVPVDLIAEEYRVRQLWGDRPDATEFIQRFPERASEVTAALKQIDHDLEKEGKPKAVAESVGALASAKSIDLSNIPQFEYGDFVLEAFLGSGGIGKVYRAWWKSQKQHVAVKMLRKNWWRQAGADEIFFREATILIGLRHPSIVSVHGIGRIGRGGCFLVIDLIDGGDLARPLGESIPADQAIDFVAQAADGLAYAHREGIVHRDVKPSNLLLDKSGKVRVADFGLALVPSFEKEAADGLIGTVAYMAPEQLFGTYPVGPPADIFSLGAVLFTLLTGQPPFEGGSLTDVVEQRLNRGQPTPLRTIRPDLRANVEMIVNRCLANNPKERFASADELAAALHRVVAN